MRSFCIMGSLQLLSRCARLRNDFMLLDATEAPVMISGTEAMTPAVLRCCPSVNCPVQSRNMGHNGVGVPFS